MMATQRMFLSKGRLLISMKYQFAEDWDVVSEIDTRYGVIGEAPQEESAFWGLNVSGYSKWLADVELLKVISDGVTRIGKWLLALVFRLGENELFAAADFLNPVNAQGDVIGLLSDPRVAKNHLGDRCELSTRRQCLSAGRGSGF